MRINQLKLLPKYMLSGMEFVASKFRVIIKWFFGNKSHWSGLIPTVLLAIAAFWALQKTSDQLRILQEQISYVREPVVIVYLRPVGDANCLALHIANIGNDTVENVDVRPRLFLANETEIYSYGQFSDPTYYFGDTIRKPKERQLPRLTLAPNEERNLTPRLMGLLWSAFLTAPPKEEEARLELYAVRDLFKGDYVLVLEYSYRRRSDFVEQRDTTFWHYRPFPKGMHEDLTLQIGGAKVIDRLKQYMRDGPQFSINIRSETYEVYKHTFGARAAVTRIVPRKRKEE